jgi:hypothetical protein
LSGQLAPHIHHFALGRRCRRMSKRCHWRRKSHWKNISIYWLSQCLRYSPTSGLSQSREMHHTVSAMYGHIYHVIYSNLRRQTAAKPYTESGTGTVKCRKAPFFLQTSSVGVGRGGRRPQKATFGPFAGPLGPKMAIYGPRVGPSCGHAKVGEGGRPGGNTRRQF